MPDDPTLADQIKDNALGPKRAQGDAGSVEQHFLRDQIAADQYLKQIETLKNGSGLRFNRLVPPGGVN